MTPTIADRVISRAVLTRNLRGPWFADVEFHAASDSVPSGRVSLVLADGVTLSGTVVATGSLAEHGRARVVGGAGGFSRSVTAQQYVGVTFQIIVSDLLGLVGESLSDTSDAATLSTVVQTWTRSERSAGLELSAVCDALAVSWRTLDDGSVWIGPETWPEQKVTAQVLEDLQEQRLTTIGPDSPSLRPGVTWQGRRVLAVEHTVATVVRSRLWTYGSGQATPGLGSALAAFARAALPLLYLSLHPSTVVRQDGDTLEVTPDDPAVPPMVGVPLRTGIPGVSVTVLAGARVLLAFEEHDPRKPIALPAFDKSSDKLDALTITAQTKVTVNAPAVNLGDESGDLVASSAKVDSALNALKQVFSNWTPVPMDGGAALKALLAAMLTGPPAWPASTAVSKTKAS